MNAIIKKINKKLHAVKRINKSQKIQNYLTIPPLINTDKNNASIPMIFSKKQSRKKQESKIHQSPKIQKSIAVTSKLNIKKTISTQMFEHIPQQEKLKPEIKKINLKMTELNQKNPKINTVTAAKNKLKNKTKQLVVKTNKIITENLQAVLETKNQIVLTEEQILQMSEKDYMNKAQLAFFRLRLQQLEKDLLKNAGKTTEHLRETILVPDPADRATIEEEHALELRTRDRERKLLKKVQQSIMAIDFGEYGWCEETGEAIGIPRLLARPTATLSLEAQQRRELKQKLYGD